MSAQRTGTVLLLLLAAAGCGVGDEQILIEADDEWTGQEELGARSPNDRVVVWQQNVEAMKAAVVAPKPLTDAMRAYTYRPDIVVLQEAWQRVLCGDYLNAGTDVALQNWKESTVDANGLASACRLGAAPLPGSLLHQMGTALWGGANNAGHRRPFSNTLGSHSRTGVAVVWDETRFELVDDFAYDDSDVPGCALTLESYKRVAVLLNDTRRTATTADDKLIAVASAHYGSTCPSSNNKYVAEQMATRWGTFGGRALSLRLIGGDFNARVDETSATYSERRREEEKASWYTAVTANATWKGGRFVDAIEVKNRTGSGDAAGLCAQWTYPNVKSCAAKTACSATCPGFGIGGKLDRLDYLFVSNGTGSFAPSRIISAVTDDLSAVYSDHKGTRLSIGY